MLGKIIGGRYQIVRHLGGGGFGQTYLAEDQHLPGKPSCVVKLLRPKVTDPRAMQVARRLFHREAEMLSKLGKHDQIPRLFAHFEEQNQFYLVQEFIEGEVFSRFLKKSDRLSEMQVIALLQDVLNTLSFVHQHQVVHRDIKPSNLILRKTDQRIVLIDFGAVKQIDQSSSNEDSTNVTIAVGSMGYMPNEQLAGKPRLSSDVYAVGMVAIRALTGLYPAQLLDDPRSGEVLWQEHAHVGPELAAILDRMICYDHRQRYQSAGEVLQALTALGIRPSLSPTTPGLFMDGHLAWLERGDELFQAHRYPEAIACYDKALQANPDNGLLWLKRGIALESLNHHEEAVKSFEQTLRLAPEDYLAWFKRGKALESLSRYEEAAEAYQRVTELQPTNYWAWYDCGRVLEACDRHEEAVRAYTRAVQIAPDFQLAITSRKRILSQLKQVDQLFGLHHYDEAVQSCDRAIQANPNDGLAWLMRGMALENLGHTEAAIASYDRVVQLQPDDHLAWLKRGNLLEKVNRYKEATLSYTKVVQLQPDNYWAWHDRGRVLEILRLYEAALTSYDRAVQLKHDFTSAYEGRQRVLHRLQNRHSNSTTQLQPTGNSGL